MKRVHNISSKCIKMLSVYTYTWVQFESTQFFAKIIFYLSHDNGTCKSRQGQQVII